MPLHFPSLLAGSALSGAAFLIVHQQISFRNRLTYKWSVAEYAETTMREQWNDIKAKLNNSDHAPSQISTSQAAPVTSMWNQAISSVKEVFESSPTPKKDQ